MRLVEEGVLVLDDLVEKFVPEVRQVQGYDSHPPITLRHILTHTTGWQREPSDPALLVGPFSEWEVLTLAALPTLHYEHEPGTKYQYCNISWALLGVALGRAAAPSLGKAVLVPGGAYPRLLYTRVLKPLGLQHSTLLPTPADPRWNDLAAGYEDEDLWEPAVEHAGRGYKCPNGALYSCMSDMAVFMDAITPGSKVGLLSEASILEMTSPHVNTAGAVATSAGVDGVLGDDSTSSYGFGTVGNEELHGAMVTTPGLDTRAAADTG